MHAQSCAMRMSDCLFLACASILSDLELFCSNVMASSMCRIKRRYVFDVVRAVVPKIDLDNVFIAKEEIAQDVQATLTKVRCVGAFLSVFVATLHGHVIFDVLSMLDHA